MVTSAIVCAGCGGEESPGIEGGWITEQAGGADCATGLYLAKDGSYEIDRVCTLLDGGIGIEAHAGTYDTGPDGELSLHRTHSSCGGSAETIDRFAYELTDGRLRLTSDAAVFVFERLADGDDDWVGTAQYGCFADDWTFVPGSIRRL